jgi:hypothetical protein
MMLKEIVEKIDSIIENPQDDICNELLEIKEELEKESDLKQEMLGVIENVYELLFNESKNHSISRNELNNIIQKAKEIIK